MEFPFQKDSRKIVWKIHLKSSPAKVYKYLSTNEGRSSWWAETAYESNGYIEYNFENNFYYRGKIVKKIKNKKFAVIYLGSVVTFILKPDGKRGTDLTLSHAIPITNSDRMETAAGWVSVLLTLKAAVDFGVDLRNHQAKRAWIFGYCDN